MALINKYTFLAFSFTGLNALCGCLGILFALFFSENFPFVPMQLLIFGAIFDFLDGKMAKKAPITSTLGAYSDSIGDVITFAILPGIMLLNSPLIGNDIIELKSIIALGIAGLYTFCAWIRLIRFAAHPTEIYFDGLPSPAAALLVGSSALLATMPEMIWIFWLNGIPLSMVVLTISVLMILTINYPTPKRGKTPDMVAIAIAGIVVITFVFLPSYFTLTFILFIALLYTTLGPLYLQQTS
ncbi:MAG: CDP-alcohol phosphatidyltransferase family protein [Candidatus Hodarchaeales archaeon]